ncbi:short-chain dehydrogenase [Roridomyces roridus]|uniref:Short-chain dehydrogenase n=1 Tax=Roridomyces roridus TaxID=1738132 RepID=A0AAD7BCU0_9AGAR|nr:short-chain dehydrogenase [Roridomyces roridus]
MQPGRSIILKDQRAKQPPVFKEDLTGKTVCVLGANIGLGFETCKHLASMNAGRIILACRSQAKGDEAVKKIQQDTGYTNAETWVVDFADFASIKRFADRWEQDGGRLDILIANAAAEPGRYVPTKDGWETTLGVNYLGVSLTGLLLVPRLLQTGEANGSISRLVFVSSILHYDFVIDKETLSKKGQILKTLGSEEYCQDAKRMRMHYSITKILNVFFTRALSQRLGPSAPLAVTVVAPGFCVSNLRRDFKGGLAIFLKIMESMIAFPTEVGSRRLVYAALGPANQLRGEYVDWGCEVHEPSDFIVGKGQNGVNGGIALQDAIWEETIAIFGQVDARVGGIVQRYLRA